MDGRPPAFFFLSCHGFTYLAGSVGSEDMARSVVSRFSSSFSNARIVFCACSSSCRASSRACRASSRACCASCRACFLAPSIISLTNTTIASITRVPTAVVPSTAPKVSDATVIRTPSGHPVTHTVYQTHPVADAISHLADSNRVACAPASSQSASTPETRAMSNPTRFNGKRMA